MPNQAARTFTLADLGKLVQQHPLFASLTLDECHQLVERSIVRSLRKGEVLFRPGEPCRGVYLLAEGTIRIYQANQFGQEQVMDVIGPGETVGEVATFDEGPYIGSTQSMGDGRAIFIPLEVMHDLYRTHPAVARAALRALGRRVRQLAAMVHGLALQPVVGRVAAAVARDAEDQGMLRVGGTFRLSRSQEALAMEIATTREGVARALRELRTSGVLHQRGREVEILNLQALLDKIRSAPSAAPRSEVREPQLPAQLGGSLAGKESSRVSSIGSG